MMTFYDFAMELITQCAGSSATSELSAESSVGIADLLRPVAIIVMLVDSGVTIGVTTFAKQPPNEDTSRLK